MKPEIVSRPFLAFLLEVFFFVGLLQFAATPAASAVPVWLVATALVVGCVLIPIIVLPRRHRRAAIGATRTIACLLIVFGSLPVLTGHALLTRDWALAALGAMLLFLPIRVGPDEAR